MRNIYFLVFLLLFLYLPVSLVCDEKPDISTVVKKIDELFRQESSYSLVEMTITTEHWERTLKMRIWSKGTENTLIRILEPRKERGIGTLRAGNEMWNYLPRTNKVIKIPPSMMMSSWMGSDFNNNDLVREYTFLEDYHFEYLDSHKDVEDTSGILLIKCTPKEGKPIIWEYVLVAVDPDTYIPVWQKFYDEKNNLVREMLFKEVKTFDGKLVPSVMELNPLDKPENKTILRYIELEFNKDINDAVFSLRNLRTFSN
jgi:outer membrane lipoprotein-sorting protein